MNKTNAAIVRTLLLGTSCLSVFAVDAARAQPTGGSVALGTATITNRGSNSTIIDQKTGKLIINWDSFNIAAGGTVQFKQPGTAAIALNRILGADPSSIYGSLLANGQVWIVNGNGVLFGQGSRISVGGLIATTADIADADFAAGNYSFTGGTGASVSNQGTIHTARRGYAVLSGASASNSGLIAADTGTVVIGGASAFTVDFQGDGLLRYAVTTPGIAPTSGPAGASNSGTITASRVVMTARAAADVQDAVVNNTGMISASSARVQNGEVILDGGDGDVNVGGTVQATGTASGTTGGDVTVTGRNITVADNTKIDVSGTAGGGTVRIGGDLHGAGPTPNAANVTVGAATITADATRQGNGGTVVVWSDGTTTFSGVVSAKGGAGGGNGGMVETSGGTLQVAATASVDTRAVTGTAGTWLLDPRNIDIRDHGHTDLDDSGTLPVDADSHHTDTIAPSTIVAALATTNVTLEASDDIDVRDAIVASSAYDLSLLAGGDIKVEASIQNTLASGGGAVNLIAGWDRSTLPPDALTDPSAYGHHFGSVTIEGSHGGIVAVGAASGTTTILGANLDLEAHHGDVQIGFDGAGGGDIVLRATHDVSLDTEWGHNATIGNGSFASPVDGDVTGNIDLRAGDTIDLNEGWNGGAIWIGNVAAEGFSETGNVVLISASGASNFDLTPNFEADITGGDFTLGSTGDPLEAGGLQYNSSHNLTLLSTSDLLISETISNAGSGAITLVAGWDGTTLDPDALKQTGAFGLNSGAVGIGGEFADGNVFVGTKSGSLTVLTDVLALGAVNGRAQLGYRGAGSGDISVTALDDVFLVGGDPSVNGPYAMIGNGSLDDHVTDAVSGNITLSIGGTLTIATEDFCSPDCIGSGRVTTFIGNANAIGGGPVTGNLVLLAGSVDDGGDSNGGIGRIIAADLANGDVTLGETDSEATATFTQDFSYSSAHDLTVLAAGDIDIEAGIQNSGSGAITLVAGWNGVYDPDAIGAAGTFSGGTITIGGNGGYAHDSGVGAAQGATTLYTDNLVLDGSQGIAQLGYHGAGGGDITVIANGDFENDPTNGLTIRAGNGPNHYAMIGNGSLGGDVTGDVSGKIDVEVDFGTTNFVNGFGGARAWLGNATSGPGKASGDVVVITDFGAVPTNVLTADLGTSADTGGDVFLGYTDPSDGEVSFGGMTYNSPHAFTIASPTDLLISSPIQNAGTGEVVMVAGWDQQTIGASAALLTANAYGLNDSTLTISGNNTAAGSAAGLTTALGTNIVLSGGTGYAQIGWHGNGGGNIQVIATNNLTLNGGASATKYAMIGNGALNGGISASAAGGIAVQVGGTTSFHPVGGLQNAWIGNFETGASSGDLSIVTGDLGSQGGLDAMLSHDLNSGDVTLAITDSAATTTLTGSYVYNSAHEFDLLAAGNLTIAGNIQNSGSGNIVLMAGWDGTTFDAEHFSDAGVYGNNSGSLTIGGGSASGSAAVGSAGGLTGALGYDIDVNAVDGNAQLGYAGNGSGSIIALATHDVSVTTASSSVYAILGNGGSGASTTNVGGDISVTAGNSVFVTAGASNSSAKIGNGEQGGLGTVGGNVSVTALGGNVSVATTADTSLAQIGNGFDSQSDVSGGITVRGATVSLATGGTDSSAQIGNSGAANMNGAIEIDATDVSMIAGADSSTLQIGNGGDNLGSGSGSVSFGGNIVVNAAHTLTMSTAHALTGVWIGNGGDNTATGLTLSGGLTYSGDIALDVGSANQAGTLTMTQSGPGASSVYVGNGGYHAGYGTTASDGIAASGIIGLTVLGGSTHGAVMSVVNSGTAQGAVFIGNGGVGSAGATVSGNIEIAVDGALGFAGTGSNGAYAGNSALAPATESGELTIVAQSLAGVEQSLDHALVGGDVLIEVLGAGPFTIDPPVTYNSNGRLEILAKGNVVIADSVQSAGFGDIDVVAGWNGTTTNLAHLGDAGVYGNNGGSITIGGATASSAVAVGSAGGATNLYAQDVTLSSINGSTQLGYAGAATGAVNVFALGAVTLNGGGDLAHFAQIGSGSIFGANANAGDVTVTAASIQGNGIASLVGDDVSLTAGAGGIGNSNAALQVAVNSLTLQTSGAGAYLSTPRSILLAGADLAGGSLTLAAGGAITQTGAILSGALNVSTTSGAITLSNSGNALGAITVSTTGSDGAAFVNLGTVTVTSAHVGGTLSISARNILQTGAITAAGLDLTTASGLNTSPTFGTIVLTNSGNSFATLSLSTPGSSAASVVDSTAVVLGTSSVGGAFTLNAGGAVTQNGALVSGALNVSTTSGAITLTSAGNAFGALTVSTQGSDNASFAQSSLLTVASANVGGTLSLTAGTSIGQTGAIQAASLNATANNGAIVLNNTGNAFSRVAVSTVGSNGASVVDSTGFQLDTSNVGGMLSFSAGGTVTQPGTLHSAGLSATTTAGDLVLGDAGNAVSGTVTFHSAGSAYFNDTLSIAIGPSTVGGLLTLISSGGISQSGTIQAGNLAATAKAGDVVLTDAANSFASLQVSASGDASVTDASALTVDGATVGGALTLVGASIAQSGAIQAASLNATANTGGIVLNDSGNSFTTLSLSTTAANNASVTDSTGVTLAGATIGGTFTLSAGGAVGQTGAIHAGGLNATANGAIVLTDSGNAFAALALVTTGSNDATVTDSTGVSLGASSVGGTLTLSAGGAIGQSGAIQAGTLDVSTTTGAIVLTSAANAFGTLTVSTQNSDNASIVDAVALNLAGAQVGGTLALTGASIGQVGAIHAAALNATATSGAIALTDAGNAFAMLNLSTSGANDASVADSTAVTLTGATVGGTLTLAGGGAITQSNAILSGALNVSTTSGAITLTNAGNAFGGLTVSTTGSDNAAFVQAGLLTVASAHVGGSLSLTAGSSIAQTGAILAAGVNATANSGTIVLTNAGNSFATLALATTGGNGATVTDSTGLSLGASTVGGTLTLSAGGAVGQSGALHSAGLSVTTSSGDIVLTNASNTVSGTVAFNTPGAVSFVDTAPVNLGGTSVGGSFTLQSGGAISQTGAIAAASFSATASGSIVLTNSGNSFAALTLSTTAGNGATVTDSTGVSLGASTIGGALTLSAGGAVGQSGALQSASLSVTTSTGDVVLNNATNAVSGAVAFHTPGAARFTDTASIGLGATSVGGLLTLVSGGGISQTGAVQAASLNATANGGAIVLTNSGNSFATLTLATASTNNSAVTDSIGVTLAASTVGGRLTLSAGGAVGQSGALQSAGLNVSTTSGDITLTNAANAVSGVAQFSTPGALAFYDTLGLAFGGATVGGDLTLLSKGDVGFVGSVQSTSGAVTVVAGWDGATTNAAQFGNSGVYGNNGGSVTIGGAGATGAARVGSQSGATTVYAANLDILGINGGAQLGYHGAGGGAITVAVLHDVNITAGAGNALLGNGSLGNDVSGNATGDIDVRMGGDIGLTDSTNGTAWLGNVANAGTETGNLILVANEDDSSNGGLGDIIAADIAGGDVTLGFTGGGDGGPGKNFAYNSSHTLNLLNAGSLIFTGSLQNAGSGAINLVAGWDGHTLAPASFGQAGVYGNNGKGVIIGGADAGGGVAVGSAGGATAIYGASLLLAATNGYAQLGFNGHGTGGIAVTTTGAVTLTGGGAAGDFAQIGNGGLKTSGNNSGDILITAGGDVVLTGGGGSEAYVQIGHGGAESNTGASGYSNTGAIGLTAADLTMGAGTGGAAYAQIGQGGYESGLNLAGGQALNGGDITVTVGHLVSLTGNGADGYAQIGNGGSQSNLNPSAAAGGTDSGDIVVSAPNGPDGAVTLTSGAGANAYSQIGNGGYAVNAGANATVANFTITGNVTVTDLALTGGGTDSYSLIGDGDASHNSVANITGNVVIDANGAITYTSGSGENAQATIGNFTGKGTVSGTLTGANPPSEITNDPGTIGVVVTTIANNKPNGNNPITTINTVVVTADEQNGGAAQLAAHIENAAAAPGPLASLDDKNTETTSNTADNATVVIADSLDGAKKAGVTQSILAGMLSQFNPTAAGHTVHAIPPADQDFSSWGNEALWQ